MVSKILTVDKYVLLDDWVIRSYNEPKYYSLPTFHNYVLHIKRIQIGPFFLIRAR